MEIPFFDLTRQYGSISREIDCAINAVLRSGWYILGKELELFEEEFASYIGVPYAVGVGSGTEALHLALLACGLRRGDRVITVPNTAVPTVSAIDFAGGDTVFVDIDPESYTLSPERLRERLRVDPGRVRAVVPVHLYGHPAEMDSILEIAAEYGLIVIEDCAQSHGSLYRGGKTGSLGDAGCFSFYPTKNLGAYGDAGMVVTGDKGIADSVRMLRNYGEESKYLNKTRGFNSRLDDIQAAVLRAKLKYLDVWNETRRHHARTYGDLLKESGLILPSEKGDVRHVYHQYVVRAADREGLKDFLHKRGIATAIHYPMPIHFQEAFADLGYVKGDFPVAEKCMEEILSIPIFPELTEQEISMICDALRSY